MKTLFCWSNVLSVATSGVQAASYELYYWMLSCVLPASAVWLVHRLQVGTFPSKHVPHAANGICRPSACNSVHILSTVHGGERERESK